MKQKADVDLRQALHQESITQVRIHIVVYWVSRSWMLYTKHLMDLLCEMTGRNCFTLSIKHAEKTHKTFNVQVTANMMEEQFYK